jgi:glycosyltransferase involved in cell wall biosynthesis
MIGYREPGYLWKIKTIPFVWGPVGGFNFVPIRYLPFLGPKYALFYTVKNILNYIQAKASWRVHKAASNAKLILAASGSSKYNLKKFYNKNSIILNETGCHLNMNNTHPESTKPHEEFHILWVGRFIPTKMLGLALSTIKKIKDLKGLTFHIVGGGVETFEMDSWKNQAKSLGIQSMCNWHGKVTRDEVDSIMKSCDLFFFTSIVEATSTVIMEAISNSLPILCFDTCGHGEIVTDDIGRKIPLENPDKSIKRFANEIEKLYFNRQLLKKLSANCKTKILDLSLEEQGGKMIALYQKNI